MQAENLVVVNADIKADGVMVDFNYRYSDVLKPPNEPYAMSTRTVSAHVADSTSRTDSNRSKCNAVKPKIATSLTDPRVPAAFQGFLRMHTNGITYMQCDKCPFICRPLMSLFLKHYKTHITDGNSMWSNIREFEKTVPEVDVEPVLTVATYKCDKCPKEYGKRKSLCRHLKTHDKRIYKCKKCGCKFKTITAFRAHKERHKRKQEQYFCGQCGKCFRSKDGYKYHRANRCILGECKVCGETLNGAVAMKEHMRSIHDVLVSDTEEERRLEASSSMCSVCGKIVKDINLDRHMITHTEERPFVCQLCGKRFKFKSAIRDHMMIKLGMKDYICEICGRKFVKKCYLTKHVKFHVTSAEDEKQWRCEICGKQFRDKKLALAHRRSSHDAEKPFSCDLCSKSYTTKACLRQHLLREVICLLCDEIFTSNDLLKQHVISNHTLERYRKAANHEIVSESSFVYPCDICGRRFTSEERYEQHIASESICELCDARFTKSDQLKTHIENKHDPQEYRKIMSLRRRKRIKLGDVNSTEYTCSLCGKKLFYKRTLLLHMRQHSGLKPFKCEYCNKAYTSKHSLNAHLVSEMNLRKFVCSYCGKRYNFNSDLVVHVKQRHQTRQFSCHVCGKQFGLLKYLRDHSTIHSQVKPFNCDECGIGFRLKKFLLRHNKKYHPEEQQVFDVEVVTDE